jgi:predicted ABC-type ATPase
MNTNAGPILMMIRGVPGSGKSYLAAALKKSLGQDGVVVLDPDAIDQTNEAYLNFSKQLALEGVDEKFHPYRFSRAQAYEAITSGKIIIWNQAFVNLDGFEKTVNNLRTYATEHGVRLPLLVVEVAVNTTTAKSRITERQAQGGHGVPGEAFARFVGDYASFSEKGYDVVSVNGEDNIAMSVAIVKKALDAAR